MDMKYIVAQLIKIFFFEHQNNLIYLFCIELLEDNNPLDKS